MGIGGGLLSSLITQGVNAEGANQGAQLEAKRLQIGQAIQAMMMQHELAKDAALMDMERSRGAYYGKLAGQPTLKSSGGGLYDVSDPSNPKPVIAPTTHYRPQAFNWNGQPTQGFTDDQGDFFDANHQKLSGSFTPFRSGGEDTGESPAEKRAAKLVAADRGALGATTTQLGQVGGQLRSAGFDPSFATHADSVAVAPLLQRQQSLQQRADSISGAMDRHIAQMQGGAPAPAHAPPTTPMPPNTGAVAPHKLSPATAAAMQAEFQRNAENYQYIINSTNATPEQRLQAKVLYDRQNKATALRYGAAAAPPDQP